MLPHGMPDAGVARPACKRSGVHGLPAPALHRSCPPRAAPHLPGAGGGAGGRAAARHAAGVGRRGGVGGPSDSAWRLSNIRGEGAAVSGRPPGVDRSPGVAPPSCGAPCSTARLLYRPLLLLNTQTAPRLAAPSTPCAAIVIALCQRSGIPTAGTQRTRTPRCARPPPTFPPRPWCASPPQTRPATYRCPPAR